MTYTRDDIVREARSLLGVRYVHQARSRVAGVDCAGAIACVKTALGETPEDFLEYGMLAKPDVLLDWSRKNFDEIDVSDVKPGDVLVFSMAGRNTPRHFGILTGNGTFVHALHKYEKVTETKLAGRWKHRLCRAFRFWGVGED